MTQFIKREFKGGNAVENFPCGRTKTAIIINCIGDHLYHDLIKDMRKTPFSIMVDGSNDSGVIIMFPISVRIFDINYRGTMTNFLT